MTKVDVEAPAAREEIPHEHLFRVTGLSDTNLKKMGQDPPSDFEAAIAATGYGRFNILLMLCSLPAFWSAVSVTSSTSYIYTRAQCHMQLSFIDIGTLSAITYGGMIFSALLWGFLSDTLGRRRIMAWGFLAAGVCDVCAALSQNFTMLLVTRFTCGFLFNGPFAVLISYIAELHRTQLRARVILLSSLFYTIGNTTLPLLAWGLMTHDYDLYFFGDKFVIHSWNMFLLTTACVPVLTGLAFFCMPESPKFLMSRGRNEEAMQVFRKIYSMNTGKPMEEFPITSLEQEKTEKSATGLGALKAGGTQIAPLFRPPHLPWLLLVCVIHVGLMFGSNSIRLWYPQLAAMLGSSNVSLCSTLAPAALPAPGDACAPIDTDLLTYLQSAIVGVGSVLTYGIGGVLINRCGKKIVSGVCGLLSACCVLVIPLLESGPFSVTAMVTSALALTSLCQASLSSIIVDLFPTSLRAMTISCFFMTGRLGTISGTIAFPALIGLGCLPPFITIATILCAIGFAAFCLPNTNLKKLE